MTHFIEKIHRNKLLVFIGLIDLLNFVFFIR